MNRRRILLLVAALVAALGTLLVFVYARGADRRAEARFDTVDVLVAVAPIEAGESIDVIQQGAKIALKAMPRDTLVEGALSDTASLSGLVASQPILPGEQIVSGKFGGLAQSSQLPIPEDKIAVSVNLTDPARVAGFVGPGSQVAIFYAGDDEAQKTPLARLLIDDVTVLAVGSTTTTSRTTTDAEGAQTTEQLPSTLLTLAVDQSQAERIIYAAHNGEVSFGLRMADSKVADSDGVTFANLFE